jgi:tetratricopeptide (TPR) repeat protein
MMMASKTLRFVSSLLAVAIYIAGAHAIPAWAHGGLDEQIARLDEQIKKQPRDPSLLLRRAELHRLHGDFAAAEEDYSRTLQLSPDSTAAELGRGKLFLQLKQFEKARAALDRALRLQHANTEAWLTRARVLRAQGQLSAAAEDYAEAIARALSPEPDPFLERAEVLAKLNRPAEAIATLDAGNAALGPLATLQLMAVDVELQRGRYDAALARLDSVASQAARKESWLARKGEILERAGRNSEAEQAYREALAAIDSAPPARANSPANQRLQQNLRASLQRVQLREK